MKTNKKIRYIREKQLLTRLVSQYEKMNNVAPKRVSKRSRTLKMSKAGMFIMNKIYRCCVRLLEMNGSDTKARYVFEKMRNDQWLLENGLDVNYVPRRGKLMSAEERVAHREKTEARIRERYPERWANLVALREKRERAKELKRQELEAHRVWREKLEAFRKEQANYFAGIDEFRAKEDVIMMKEALQNGGVQ